MTARPGRARLLRRPGLLVGVLAVISAGLLATTSRAEDAAATAGRVTPAGLEQFLKDAGYEPTEKSPTGWKVISKLRREPRYQTETVFVRAKLSEDSRGQHVILSSPPVQLPDGGKIPRQHMIDMLGFNAGDSGVSFCVVDGKLLYLMRFVDNRALLASALGLEIEDFFDTIRSSVSIWDLSRESDPKKPGGAPAAPPAGAGEGMR